MGATGAFAMHLDDFYLQFRHSGNLKATPIGDANNASEGTGLPVATGGAGVRGDPGGFEEHSDNVKLTV